MVYEFVKVFYSLWHGIEKRVDKDRKQIEPVRV